VILIPFLAFCATSLLTIGIFLLFVRRQSRSVDRLMRARLATAVALSHSGDEDLVLLRDQALSGIGPLERILARAGAGGALKRLLEQADVKMKTGTLVLSTAVLTLVGALAASALRLGLPLALLAGVLVGLLPILVVLRIRARRFKRFEAQFPDAIDLLSRAIRAGHAFNTGIKMISEEMPDPVGKEFQRVFEEQNYGLPIKNALMNLVDRIDLLDLRLFVVGVLIQRQSGGNLAELLGKISHTIRERFRVLRQLKVHTAQAKLTGIILLCLPPVMGGVTVALNYEYMKIIFLEPWGIRMLIAAAVLQLAGLVWIRKIVNIEV
jgi:tight adherence protein B